MGVSRENLALMRRFADEGRLPLRIDAYADGDSGALADLCEHGLYRHDGGRLQMTGVKLFMDGALGSAAARPCWSITATTRATAACWSPIRPPSARR